MRKGKRGGEEREIKERTENIWTGQHWHLTGGMIIGLGGAKPFHGCIVFYSKVFHHCPVMAYS